MLVHRIIAGIVLVPALLSAVAVQGFAAMPEILANSERQAYYGDLHLHTSYSFDAYLNGTSVDPDEAYRFAKGEEVSYLGQSVRRRESLDFLAVTDHSENIGVFNDIEAPNSLVALSDAGKAFKSVRAAFLNPDPKHPGDKSSLPDLLWDYFTGSQNKLPDNLEPGSAAAWARTIEFANRHYEPGRFTTFIAYEWTATPHGANLHRNVIFKGGAAPYPFTSFDSKYPEDLWTWLETVRKQGFEALAIPHNGNASNGLMYDWVGSTALIITRAYAELRQTNEPLSEIAQNKGASETHPLLSPNDEFAGYGVMDYLAEARHQEGRPQGSYLRDALSRGLVLQRQLGVNPYKYGFVGASDLHSGLSVSDQADYAGGLKANLGGGRPTRKQAREILGGDLTSTAGNLTGVWAESNTRESIYDSFRRRETFATSGTRLKMRFFGGWRFSNALLQDNNWVAKAYALGVPMGGELPAQPHDARAPCFVIWALKDPNSGNLDRVQVIKVWEKDGEQQEKVFDVAWAGHRTADPRTGKLPAVGSTVNLRTAEYSNTIGAVELKTIWRDPEFNPLQFAAYYVRVLEIPTPRWPAFLARQAGLSAPSEVSAIIQQRGWSSPIWYVPQIQ